jgi:hypothetical protein
VSGSVRRTLRRPSLAALAIVFAALLLAEGGLTATLGASDPFNVQVGHPIDLGTGILVPVTFTSHRAFAIDVHAALLPITYSDAPRTAFVFEDSAFAVKFGSGGDLEGVYARIQNELSQQHSSTVLAAVDAASLPAALATHPNGILVIAEGGILPSTVFSNTTDLLGPWLRAGGTLIWAAGPIGFYSQIPAGATGPNGTIGPGWAGQSQLLGYPLVDQPLNLSEQYTPVANPNLTAATPSDLAEGLGIQYNGVPFGADLTEVEVHGGVSLGYETPTLPNGVGGVTSLAYLPVGKGSLFYFGGAVDEGPGLTNVPNGGLLLSYDLAQILAFPFVPTGGPVSISNLVLASYQATTVTLGVSDRNGGAALLVQSQVIGSTLFELTEQIAAPGNSSGGVHPGG